MMKILFSILIITVVGFSKNTSEKATATVNQVNGLFIFVDCTPVSDYNYIGSVKYNSIMQRNPQYTVIRDALIKKVKKDWPNANGVMFHFSSGSADKADAIFIK